MLRYLAVAMCAMLLVVWVASVDGTAEMVAEQGVEVQGMEVAKRVNVMYN